jgi:hypothetical protein
MRKREPLNVEDYARTDSQTISSGSITTEEPLAALFCRCPLSMAERLRALAFERSKGKRRRVTQNDLLIEAVERFLSSEGI